MNWRKLLDRWLHRRAPTSPPRPPPESPEGTDINLTLDEARQRFRTALARWDAGTLTREAARAEIDTVRRSIFYRCMVLKELQTQEAYDFFNLAGEVTQAMSYEPRTKWIVPVAQELERRALGNVYAASGWRQIVRRRGPIEAFGLRECPACGLHHPCAGTSGFLMIDFLACEACGDLYEAPVCNEETEREFRVYEAWPEAGQQAAAQAAGVPWKRCVCGGVLHTTGSHCPRCGNEDQQQLPMSSFEYFETHKYRGDIRQLPPAEAHG